MRYRLTVISLCWLAVLTAACSSTSRRSGDGSATSQTTGDPVAQYLDGQARELETIHHAHAVVVDEELRITWDADALFDFDSAMLQLDSQKKIKTMAEVFIQNPETDILIVGHTDSIGSPEYNQKLSERRAFSLQQSLVDNGVAASRIESIGYGDARPIASNSTDEGRRANRRIEIRVRPTDALRAKGAEARND